VTAVELTRNGTGQDPPLVEIAGLRISLPSEDGPAKIVDGLDLSIQVGRSSAIVGESGSGKSTLARAIMGLPPRKDAIIEGSIKFEGRELLGLAETQLRRYRGREVAMVFQDPMRSFNPIMTVGNQIVEAMTIHGGIRRAAAKRRAVDLLEMVRIPAARQRYNSYPHQLSGGMRQRVMIAMALSCEPKLLIADEPTTALDVTTQAAVMELLIGLQQELGMAVLVITHDLHLAAQYAEIVSVMYAGHIIEQLPARHIASAARVPYTVGLVASIPADSSLPHSKLMAIRGNRPDPSELPPGCAFHPRCDFADERCSQERPGLTEFGREHRLACWHPVAAPPTEERP
jgi:oligopeptide/dipeptide ABC transporter ATP-binding protein